MEVFKCKCVLEFNSFKLNDEKKEKGGKFTFKVDDVYNGFIIKDDYWGDCYTVTDHITGFTMGFTLEQFNKNFYLLV